MEITKSTDKTLDKLRQRRRLQSEWKITLQKLTRPVHGQATTSLSIASNGKIRAKLACSKRSDSGERCRVKKAMNRSPPSERLEQARAKFAVSVFFFFPLKKIDLPLDSDFHWLH